MDFDKIYTLHRMFLTHSTDPTVYELEEGFPDESAMTDSGPVTFFSVGRNASHEFALGQALDGTLWCKAFDVSADEVHIYKVNDPMRMYIGHW